MAAFSFLRVDASREQVSRLIYIKYIFTPFICAHTTSVWQSLSKDRGQRGRENFALNHEYFIYLFCFPTHNVFFPGSTFTTSTKLASQSWLGAGMLR